MSASRWLARITIPTMIGAALIANAAIAAADTVDDGYLAQLRTLGFTWPPDHDAGLVILAHHICADRSWGMSPDAIAQDVHRTLGQQGLSFGDVTSLVNAAESTYCPS
jgi:Protein of unknown function (DUF732)